MGRDLVVTPLQRHTPVRAVRPPFTIRRPCPAGGLLSWGSSILPLRRHDCRCVHSRMNRRSSFDPELPRSRLVPSLPFLPATTVCSAAKPNPKTWSLGSSQVCCTLQPTVGFAPFRTSWDPKVSPCTTLVVRGCRSRPRRRGPFEAFSSPVAAFRHRGPPRSPESVAPSPLVPTERVATSDPNLDLEALLHRGVRFSSRSVSATSESMLPWALDRHDHACHAFCVGGGYPPVRAAHRLDPPRVPEAREAWEGKVFSALSGSEDRCCPHYPEVATTTDWLRSQSEDCRASQPPAPSGAGWSWPVDPIRRPNRGPAAVCLPKEAPTTRRQAPKSCRHHRSRYTRRCLDSGRPPAPPGGGPDDLRPRCHGCYTADRLPVSRAPPFVRCMIPEGTLPRTTTGLLGAARTPEGVLRSAPPRVPSRDARCDSSRATRRQLAESGRTPKGPPWLPTPAGKPLEVGSGQTDIASMRETGRDEVPTRPEGRVPTWIRRVRRRAA